jgi:DEAD/DEAH box helicase domain-containing protein
MSVETALQVLRLEPRFMRNVARWEITPARPARHASYPHELDPRVIAALAARGVTALYTHQAAAVETALHGEHVAVVTPAASGKTLCYNLPVLNRLLADPSARALYLFPTKALAQDQLAELREMVGLLNGGWETSRQVDQGGTRLQTLGASAPPPLRTTAPPLTCATYDGDTPSAQRAKVRDAARIILSNPDMLHAGILPQHPRWAAFFANLRVVVIDEMHVCRGVFGSHIANVLRRLRRICRFYGSEPQFILASATIANPAELAERLVEAPVTLIGPERDGAPQSEKHVLFYNPPLIDPDLGLRRSSSLEASDLAALFLAHAVQTIVFARARLTMELILTYLRETGQPASGIRSQESGVSGQASATPHLRRSQVGAGVSYQPSAISHKSPAIRGYRGGYLPAERREIEKGLREGSVRGVVATSALELGIDIGAMDAAVLAGYPGTVASARQQMGRAGRRRGSSIGVLVAGAGAMDQYILTHPEWLLARSPEHARINPDNEVILAHHLACAAAEMPIEKTEVFLAKLPVLAADLLDDLVEAGQFYRSGSRYFWAGDGSPANGINLRTASLERIVIQATDGNGRAQVIGELERESAPILLYEGAIYLHEGQSYLVEQLDWEAGLARVRATEVDFYTRPISSERIEILRTKDEGRKTNTNSSPVNDESIHYSASTPAKRADQLLVSSFQSAWGDVRVISQTTGYKIIRRNTQEVLSFGQVELPEQVLETQACWLTLGLELIERLKAAGAWFSDPNEYGTNWPSQRDAARARDQYRCQGCGTVEMPGRQHDVHHRIPFRAFQADSTLRGGLAQQCAWQAANVLGNLVTLCPTCHHRAEAGVRIRSGLGGVATLLAGVAPMFLMCDPRDLGVLAEPQDPTSGQPTITLYERVPGGIGYAEQLFASMPALLRAAHDLVTSCPCERGCPACVGPVIEHEYALDTKTLAAALLREMCI